MEIKFTFLHFFIVLLIPLMTSSLLSDLRCVRDPQDSSTCTFSGITDSTHFYVNLINNEDISKASIRRIRFSDTQMTHMPKELTTTYTNVEDLDASNVQLWRFVNIDFAQNTNLKKMNVSFNKIHWLTTDMCDGMKNLENLDFSHNMIDLIDRNAFTYNQNLKYLNLSYNRIGKLGDDFFTAVRSVRILHLDHNRISSIYGDLANINMNLDELYLSDNELVKFDPVLVKQVTYLDISSNNLEGEMNFDETKLTELNIRGNSLQSLTINNELKKLDASDNTERSFGVSFGSNIILTYLSLSNLDIVYYDEILGRLKNLHSLEFLDLSQNNLEVFDFKAHLLPSSLKTLNLRRADLHSMINWKNLRSLLPKLQEINILDNFLSCTELPHILKQFKQFNLTVTGLSGENEDKFVEKNCAAETHRKRKPAKAEGSQNNQDNSGNGNAALWTLLIICLLGYFCAAVIYFNHKFDIIQRLIKKTSRSDNFNQYNNPRTNLIEE